jgi:Flp pilus assembly protein TadD
MPTPMLMDARLHLAQKQQVAGAWLAAAATYAQLAADHPFDHRMLANQANALWLADLPDAARDRYVRALKISPNCPVSKRGLASCLRDLNQFEAALALHQELEAVLQPGSPDRLANLWAHSQVLVGLERFAEAFQRMASWNRSWPSACWQD